MSTPAPAPRSTRQRQAISDLLERLDGFSSAQQLHDVLRHDGQEVGLTTVYRTLTALADAGAVDVVRTSEGEALYRRCSPAHHHHLVCRVCGRTVEVSAPSVETWAQKVAAEHGFTAAEHTVEVTGTCPTCSTP
jgi:Fur family ferric uptake transcriptional regulator